jgi:hypothetical protein
MSDAATMVLCVSPEATRAPGQLFARYLPRLRLSAPTGCRCRRSLVDT